MALNFIQQLLTGAGLQPQEIDENGIPVGVGDDINVGGDVLQPPPEGRPIFQSGGPEAPDMGNVNYLEAALMANEKGSDTARGMRKGRFGVGGTLRDVLGTLGDAFLVQSGRDTVYQPQRERERLADAQTGYTESPEAAMAAIERMSAAGYGEEAQKLYEAVEANRLRQAQAQGLADTRQSQIEARDYKMYEDATNSIARVFASPQAQANPAGALQIAQAVAAKAQIPLEQLLGVPIDQVTPDFMRLYAPRDMKVNQTMELPFTERRVAATESQAASSATRAANDTTRTNRPPPPRAARAQTPLEYFQELSDVPPSQRTADERAWMTKYTKSGTTRGSAPRAAPQGVAPRTSPSGAAPGWGTARVK